MASAGAGAPNSGPAGPGGLGGYPGAPGGVYPGAQGGGPGRGPGGPGGRRHSPLGEAMEKIGEGPNALQKQLEAGLKADAPAWDVIQPQTKQYAELAAESAKYEPPRGDKESWNKLVGAFADTAADLDAAAQAKDKDASLAALSGLSTSCKQCHDQHRMGPPGGGFGPPGGFRPGGPGGPGGPPPGGGPGGPPPGGGPGGPPPGGGAPPPGAV